MVLSIERWVGKVAVITGASSGIGAAIAARLVEEGLKVVGLARRKSKMEEHVKQLEGKKGTFYPFQTDLTKEQDILNAFKWVRDNLGPVHILVNNAGFLVNSEMDQVDTKTMERLIAVNVIAPCIATREAVKDMKANGVDGQIIHINDVQGHQIIHFPGQNIYAATKHAVTALAETLRLELNASKSKIKITSLSPGAVNSNNTDDNLSEEMVQLVKTMIREKAILDPEDIVDGVVYVLSTPPHVQIQELSIRTVIEPPVYS